MIVSSSVNLFSTLNIRKLKEKLTDGLVIQKRACKEKMKEDKMEILMNSNIFPTSFICFPLIFISKLVEVVLSVPTCLDHSWSAPHYPN